MLVPAVGSRRNRLLNQGVAQIGMQRPRMHSA